MSSLFAPDMEIVMESEGGRLALGRVADRLSEGRSVLWVMPDCILASRVRDEVWRALRNLLRRQETSGERIDLTLLDGKLGLEREIAAALSLRWPAAASTASHRARPLETLLEISDLPRVLLLDNWAQLPEERGARWLAWMQLFQSVCKDHAFPPALCAFLPLKWAEVWREQVANAPADSSLLWWMDVASQLDVRAWCRRRNREEGAFSSARRDAGQYENVLRARWRESVIPAIALDDFDLAHELWDAVLEADLATEALPEVLAAYCQKRAWDAETLAKLHPAVGQMERAADVETARMPAKCWHALWNCGAWLRTLEDGPQIHSAALHSLGQTEILKHRLWRGQASLVLPFLDEVRHQICADLCATYGHDWPLWETRLFSRGQFSPDAKELEQLRLTAHACDWGRLYVQLRHCDALESHRFWLETAYAAKQLRNELAHHRPISWPQLSQLIREWSAAKS